MSGNSEKKIQPRSAAQINRVKLKGKTMVASAIPIALLKFLCITVAR